MTISQQTGPSGKRLWRVTCLTGKSTSPGLLDTRFWNLPIGTQLLWFHEPSFSFYVCLAYGSVHKHVKRELDQYSPIRTKCEVNKIYEVSSIRHRTDLELWLIWYLAVYILFYWQMIVRLSVLSLTLNLQKCIYWYVATHESQRTLHI